MSPQQVQAAWSWASGWTLHPECPPRQRARWAQTPARVCTEHPCPRWPPSVGAGAAWASPVAPQTHPSISQPASAAREMGSKMRDTAPRGKTQASQVPPGTGSAAPLLHVIRCSFLIPSCGAAGFPINAETYLLGHETGHQALRAQRLLGPPASTPQCAGGGRAVTRQAPGQAGAVRAQSPGVCATVCPISFISFC